MPKRLQLRRFRRGEKQMLEAKLHDRKLPAWAMHRYQIIARVREGQSVFQAAYQVGCAPNTAYRWAARFNQSGFQTFEQSSNPEGRPSQLTQEQQQLLIQTARKRPTEVGLPFTSWSMTKLQDYLVKRCRFPPVSPEWLRRLLRRADVSWQHTKTWKQSNDPHFQAKKKRILALYAHRPKRGAVVCYDQLGPLELRPIAGMCWAIKGKPQRQRATYTRKQGIEQLHGFYDVHTDCLVGRVRKRKTAQDIIACFARLRRCYPRQIRLYVVMDNLSANVAAAKALFPGHNMEAVYTPTDASWLNAIESEFTSLHADTIKNSDDLNHLHRRRRIYRYLRWRNRRHGSTKSYLARFMR
jgi:transposase